MSLLLESLLVLSVVGINGDFSYTAEHHPGCRCGIAAILAPFTSVMVVTTYLLNADIGLLRNE